MSTDEEIQAQRRKEVYGIADPDQVQASAKHPSAVWLDVREADEITMTGQFVATDKRWMHAASNDNGCPMLFTAAENMIQDKIIVYCSSGRRAQMA